MAANVWNDLLEIFVLLSATYGFTRAAYLAPGHDVTERFFVAIGYGLEKHALSALLRLWMGAD